MRTERARSAVFFAQYGAILLYALAWVHFADVRQRVGENIGLFHALLAFAFCYVGLRAFFVVGRRVSRSWHPAWVAVDLAIITGAVRLTGGINSEAALVYFWPLATYSIQRRPRGTLMLGLAIAVLYVAATWPGQITEPYLQKLCTRVFVLVLLTVLATCYALHEITRVEEIARLREKVSLADYRARLSQEMHDGIQHYLVGIAVRLEMARKLMEEDAGRAARMAVDQRYAVGQAADELRYLVRRLRSPVIEERGFVDALRDHLGMFAERVGVSVPLAIGGEPAPLPPDVEQAAFRIVQEALTNAEKHAGASEVKVRLSFAPERFEGLIADNGVGFDPAQVPAEPDIEGGFGLSSMKQRAEALGGKLEIESAPGQGTRVSFGIPVGNQEREQGG
jgi:signal transduction histidine kinase